MKTKKQLTEVIKSIIEVAHVEFNYYDLSKEELICSSGLAQKILGYSKEEYAKISKHFFIPIIHPDDMESILAWKRMIQLSLENKITETTARFRKADGDYIWVHTRHIITERNSEGQASKILSISEDITTLMILQKELKNHVKTLNKIALKNSHEIRGPVATIIGITNLMNEHLFMNAFDKQLFQFLKMTVQKLDKAIHVINELTHVKQ
jgi:PAS domain S-box-containing protein